MNKQELIDELKRISLEKQHKALTHPESKNYYEGMVMAYSQVVHMVNTVLKLDEPQKPVVPKFVADYIEEYRGGGATLYEMMDSSEDEVYTWLFGNPRIETENERQLLFAQAYAVGYEVEKEPLYSVIIAGEYLVKEISCSNEVKLVSTAYLPQYLAHHYQLTEKQIKEIDERYWPFAVPVEEGLEQEEEG